MTQKLKEYLRIQLLRLFRAAGQLGYRFDGVHQHIRLHPEFRSITEDDLEAELQILIANGWVDSIPVDLAPGEFLYRLTTKCADFCLRQGIE
jgi:hypothetical protein